MTSKIEDTLATLTNSNTVIKSDEAAQQSPATMPTEVYLVLYTIDGETPHYVDAVHRTWAKAMAYSGLKLGLSIPTDEQCGQAYINDGEWVLSSADGNAECFIKRHTVNNDANDAEPSNLNTVYIILAVQSAKMDSGFLFSVVGFVVARVYANYWSAQNACEECRQEIEAFGRWKRVFMKLLTFEVC
ncbi:MAG: hypothetical protein LQ337_001987 [Flavoplaca oasis]|nr:MAG: hypothetical protein LQ337_001987 [Flavoplaca oasis]